MGEKCGFKKCMTKATGDLLDELEVWVGRMEDGRDLAHQTAEISEHFTSLLKTRAGRAGKRQKKPML